MNSKLFYIVNFTDFLLLLWVWLKFDVMFVRIFIYLNLYRKKNKFWKTSGVGEKWKSAEMLKFSNQFWWLTDFNFKAECTYTIWAKLRQKFELYNIY